MSMRQRAENRIRDLAGTASEAGIVSYAFNFSQAAAHRRLGPAHYLILMRQYHGKGNWRRSARRVSQSDV